MIKNLSRDALALKRIMISSWLLDSTFIHKTGRITRTIPIKTSKCRTLKIQTLQNSSETLRIAKYLKVTLVTPLISSLDFQDWATLIASVTITLRRVWTPLPNSMMRIDSWVGLVSSLNHASPKVITKMSLITFLICQVLNPMSWVTWTRRSIWALKEASQSILISMSYRLASCPRTWCFEIPYLKVNWLMLNSKIIKTSANLLR